MTTFRPESRAEIEAEIAAVVRNYDVRESTACLFKTKYLVYLCDGAKQEDSQPVNVLPPGPQGHLLLLGELDKKVWAYLCWKLCRYHYHHDSRCWWDYTCLRQNYAGQIQWPC